MRIRDRSGDEPAPVAVVGCETPIGELWVAASALGVVWAGVGEEDDLVTYAELEGISRAMTTGDRKLLQNGQHYKSRSISRAGGGHSPYHWISARRRSSRQPFWTRWPSGSHSVRQPATGTWANAPAGRELPGPWGISWPTAPSRSLCRVIESFMRTEPWEATRERTVWRGSGGRRGCLSSKRS